MKTTKRFLPLFMALCMILTCFTFSVGAEDQAETVVVCADTAYQPLEGEKVFTTVSDAITYLGVDGGTVYIKGDISFSNGNNATPLNFEGSVENRGLITICGYGNSNTAGSISFNNTNPGTAYIKGDITFENITIYGTSSEYPIASIGHKMTFGQNVLTPSGKYLLGARDDNGGDHKVDIYSGTYGYAVPVFYNASWGLNNKKGSSEYNIYGGTVTSVYLGTRNVSSNVPRVHSLNGNSIVNIYGGTVTKAVIGHEHSGTIRGDSILSIYGGSVSNVGFANSTLKDTQNFGNAVIAIYSNGKDGSTFGKSIAITKETYAPAKTDESKKFIAIINNAEEGSHSFDATLTGDYCDYMLKVSNGIAQPVFETTTANDPSTSTFRGFKFIADGDNGYHVPTVDGKKLYPMENGLYDLSAYENAGTVEIALVEFLTPVVTTDNTFVPKTGEKVFTTVSSAIDYLGKSGGDIYVYGDISFANNNGTPLNFEGTTENRELITIQGYGNSNTAGSISFTSTNPGTAYIKGDITFKNITIHGTSSEYPIASIGHTMTFGENLLTPSGKYLLGTREDNGGNHKMEIYSGTFQYVVPVFYNAGWGLNNKKVSSEYNIYGGTVSNLYLGARNASSNISRVHMINGDSIANIYGGTVKNANVGHEYSGTIYGDSILNLYGGTMTNVGFINTYEKDTQNLGNAVITIWTKGKDGSTFTKPIAIKQGTLAPPKTTDTKKRIAIINNADKGQHTFDASLTAEYCDYILRVNNGAAEPVFERTDSANPSTSTFKGFKFTEEYEGAEPYVGNVKLVKDANGVYDLSAYENKGETVVDFKHYGQHWVKYGATGTGDSPENPAPSVTYLINNSIANTYAAGEEVTVYVLQDDGEELYNSTAYVTSDTSYVAQPIGEKPVSHILPWKSSTDTAAAEHAASIVVKSYDDGGADKHYLMFSDVLGVPANLELSGDTTFDNIILVSPKKDHQSIYTNGHNVQFTENCVMKGINAYYAENGDTAWNGTFVDSQGTNAVMNKDGGNIAIDFPFQATTSGRQITVGAEGDTFTKDANIYINSTSVKTPIYIGNTTFNKNLNIISAGTNVLNIRYGANAAVNGAIQHIYDNSTATLNNIDYLRTSLGNLEAINPAGGIWVLRTEHTETETGGMYVDVTETAGTFKCTREGGILLAQNTATLEHTVSKNGLLTIPAGTYDVYFLKPEEGKKYVNAKTFIVALEDTEVDLSAEDHRILEGQIFLGWKNETTGVTPGTTATLSAGDVLTAQYDTYDTGYGGEFYIYGVQMRITSPNGLRYIIDRKNSLLEKLGGEDNIIESGSIVLPTDLTHGKDMEYGVTIYDNANRSLTTLPHHPKVELGTPAAVPAKNIFSVRDDGVLYTVVITGIADKNYSKFYSAMGYIRYYDANGNEQIMYSDYAQTSLYKIVLQAAADNADNKYSESTVELFDKIIDYVEVTAPALYYDTYIGENFEKATKHTCAIDGDGCTNPNHNMYVLSNGLNVREVNIDWDYNAEVADESDPVEIAHITDTHLNYNNAKDKNEYEASIIHAYGTSAFYGEGQTAGPVVKAMEYASLLDKVVVTGDVIHSLADGSLQISERLMFDRNTWVGIRAQYDENGNPLKKVLGTLGNHERYKHMIGVVPDDNYMTYNYPALQEYFPNDIVYHSEIMTTTEGKNPVMLVLLDDQRERYADERIRDNLTVDLAKARQKNIPVLIFQHVALYTGDSSVTSTPSYYDSGSAPNTRLPGNPNSDALTKEIHKLITDNADIVAGVFCGHEHVNVYTEIIGTGENGTGHVIPQNYLNTNQTGSGTVLKISVK